MDEKSSKFAENGFRLRIRELADGDRPRERLMHGGVSSLNNYELLAILLKTGTREMGVLEFAQSILQRFGGMGRLDRITFDELRQVKGIGQAKAAEIIAAIELGRRIHAEASAWELRPFHGAQDVYNLVGERMRSLDHEELWVLNLDSKNRLIAIDYLYKGAVNASTIRIAEIFQGAIVRKATSILMVHNHPSGDITPSTADISVTKNVIDAGKILEIKCLDHVIIGRNCYQSLLELME